MSARIARAAFAFGLTVLLLVVLVMMLVRWTDRVPPAPRFQQVTCAEDDPCWRCEDMGNRHCGPIVAP